MEHGNYDIVPESESQFSLCWSDRQAMKPMEQQVRLIHRTPGELTVISSVRISEQTPVYISGRVYTGNGRILSCWRDNLSFVLKISMRAEADFLPARHEFDPGMLDVDNFLTEEAEQQILESLKDEIPRSLTVQRSWPILLIQGLARWLAGWKTVMLPVFSSAARQG